LPGARPFRVKQHTHCRTSRCLCRVGKWLGNQILLELEARLSYVNVIMSSTPPSDWLDRMLAKLAASRFLTISVLIHVCLVIGSGSFILYKAAEEHAGMGVPGDMEFLSEGVNQVEAPPAQVDTPMPQLAQVADTMPAVSEVATPTVATTNISSALDSAITTTATTASFSIASSPGSMTSNIRSDMPSTLGQISNVARRARVAPLSGAVSQVNFLGIRSQGRRIAFLLDGSGTMVLDSKGGGAAYQALKEEIVELVNNLEPSTEFNVWIFDRQVDVFKPNAVPATNDIKSEFARWIAPFMTQQHGVLHGGNFTSDLMKGYHGTTRVDLALAGAFEMGCDIIFILTDGMPIVSRPPTEQELADWERTRERNKAEIERFDKEWKDYHEKYKDVLAEMRVELDRKNKALVGRTQERYHWIEGFKGIPPRPGPAPEGFWRPSPRLSLDDVRKLLDGLVTDLYAPAGIPRPSVNVVGYHAGDAQRDWLRNLTRSFSGTYRDFRPTRSTRR